MCTISVPIHQLPHVERGVARTGGSPVPGHYHVNAQLPVCGTEIVQGIGDGQTVDHSKQLSPKYDALDERLYGSEEDDVSIADGTAYSSHFWRPNHKLVPELLAAGSSENRRLVEHVEGSTGRCGNLGNRGAVCPLDAPALQLYVTCLRSFCDAFHADAHSRKYGHEHKARKHEEKITFTSRCRWS